MKASSSALIVLALFSSLSFSLFPIISSSQQITEIRSEGSCEDFRITITAEDLGQGCWDAKLDVPGRVYDSGDKTWKSSFYYIEKAMCYPATEASIPIKLDREDVYLQGKARLRSGGRTIEKDFELRQQCPQPLPDYWVILIAAMVILIFGYALVWWWKQ
jgi:hypothetical protein